MSALSLKQLKILGMEATLAFDLAEKHDALELPAEVMNCSKSARRDFWRQREAATITGFCSFKELNQSHYRPLLTHFQKLSGNTSGAFATALRDARDAAATTPAGAGLVRDLWHWASKAGLGRAYVTKVCQNKFGASNLDDLTMPELKQIHATIANRARKKLAIAAPPSSKPF